MNKPWHILVTRQGVKEALCGAPGSFTNGRTNFTHPERFARAEKCADCLDMQALNDSLSHAYAHHR